MKKRILTLALALLMVLSIVPFAGAATFSFTDVPSYHKDKTAIEYCVMNDFVKGYTDTRFEPDSPLTREQFAVIWGRTFHLRRHNFSDVAKVPNEFENAILVMQALGHVNGISATEFGRTSLISREQAIAIAHRAYVPGVDGKDAYKDYNDQSSISDWARESVSACKAEGLLDGVFVGNELKPKQNITRGEICHLIFNIMKKQYVITVATPITNGTVTVDKAPDPKDGKIKAYPGERVPLTVAAATNYILVPGSLKFNTTPITGTEFIMPFSDVTISAEFALKLKSIEITTQPTKTLYTVGETLNLDNMVVTATYEDNSTKVITGYTAYPAAGTKLTAPGSVSITISYTENGITETVTQRVTVS